jgi:hypothetical protein
MNVERRFIFRGNAATLGGRISRPRDVIIDADGASSLTVSGGRSRGRLTRTRFGDYVRVRAASTEADGRFDDRRAARALSYGRVAEETLATTTMVKVDVRGLAVGADPLLEIEELSASIVGRSPGPSGEPSLRTGEVRIAGVTIGGSTLVVETSDVCAKYETRSSLLAAADTPEFAEEYGSTLLLNDGPGVPPNRRLIHSGGAIYGTVVRRIRWKGKPYPGSSIDRHVVVVPGFGRLYFGEIFITRFSRRLTLARLRLGSPVGGEVAVGDIGTNGSWYP